MNAVIASSGGVEPLAVRIPGKTSIGIGNFQHLLLDRRLLPDVVNKHVLLRLLRNGLAIGIEISVEPAGENQQSIAVRTDSCRNWMIRSELRQIRQIRVERLKDRTFGRSRSDAHARGKDFASRGSLFFWLSILGRRKRECT